MLYIIIKIYHDLTSPEIYDVYHSLEGAINDLYNITSVRLDGQNYNVSQLKDIPPTDKDQDGSYLIKSNKVINRLDFWQKKTNILEGRIYNTYDVEINTKLYYQIVSFDNFDLVSQSHENYHIQRISKKEYTPCNSIPPGLAEVIIELKEKLKERTQKFKLE